MRDLKREDGQSLLEFGFILFFIVFLAFVVLSTYNVQIASLYSAVMNQVSFSWAITDPPFFPPEKSPSREGSFCYWSLTAKIRPQSDIINEESVDCEYTENPAG